MKGSDISKLSLGWKGILQILLLLYERQTKQKKLKQQPSPPKQGKQLLVDFSSLWGCVSACSIIPRPLGVFCHIPSFDLQHAAKGRWVQKYFLPSRPDAGECAYWWLSSSYLTALIMCAQQEIYLCLRECLSGSLCSPVWRVPSKSSFPA